MTEKSWLSRCGPPLWTMLVILCAAGSGYGQASRGSITGPINDPQGAVVSGATVTATNVGTGVTKTATTNDEGRYSFGAIFDPGTYTVSVEMQGFKKAISGQLVLQIGDVREVNITLEP